MISHVLIGVLSLFVAGVATPGGVAQEALDKLGKATGEAEAAALEEDVWDAWMFSGSPTVDLLMQRAEIAEAGEDLDLARDMYDRAILIRPQYAEAWNRRALLFFKDGKYDEAIADLEAVLRHEPRHFGAWISLAMIFESLDQPDAALHAYRKAVEIHPFASAAKEAVKRLIPRTEGRSF
jgi:tetratricopeptide (TPR) repeat protein